MSEHALAPERTRVCTVCRQRKYLREYYVRPTGRYNSACKSCTRAKRRARPEPLHDCAGCGTPVRRMRLCPDCRVAKQQRITETLAEMPLSPGVCGLPIRGGRCLQAIDDGTDCFGRATLFCGVHGERYAPVIRPAWTIEHGEVLSSFVRYDQRCRLDAEVQGLVASAGRPVDPAYAERALRKRNIGIQVIGRDMADRIFAA